MRRRFSMILKKHIIALSLIIPVIVLFGAADVSSDELVPVLTIPTEFEATPGEEAVIPIAIAGVAGAEIGSYAIRLDYDGTVLSNPRAVDAGTLSEGNPNLQEFTAPADGIGQYSVGIGFGFSPIQDGVLIKVRFDVSRDFTGTTAIVFAGKNGKSALATADFNTIEADLIDGSAIASGG